MDEYEFHCTACDQCISVNEGMRESLLEFGCPVCSAPVSLEQFSQLKQ